jgi:hypothetical protein
MRAIAGAQFTSHLKQIRAHIGTWRAIELTPEAVNKYIESGRTLKLRYHDQQGNLAAQSGIQPCGRPRTPSVTPSTRHLSERGSALQGFFANAEFNAVEGFLPPCLRDFAGLVTTLMYGRDDSKRNLCLIISSMTNCLGGEWRAMS